MIYLQINNQVNNFSDDVILTDLYHRIVFDMAYFITRGKLLATQN